MVGGRFGRTTDCSTGGGWGGRRDFLLLSQSFRKVYMIAISCFRVAAEERFGRLSCLC